jgi:hypothetical protein
MKSLLIMAFSILLVSISQETAFGKLNIGYNSRYDSTYGFVRYDSTSFISKNRVFTGQNVSKLLGQELFIKKHLTTYRKQHQVELWNTVNNIQRNDKSRIYQCCDSVKSKDSFNFYSNYNKIKDLTFKIIDIKSTEYYRPYLYDKINLKSNLLRETFILTLKPSNGDSNVYLWFHPYFAYINDFELLAYSSKVSELLLGKKFVISDIPYPLSDSIKDLTEKWIVKDIEIFSSDDTYAVLEDRFGRKISLNVGKNFIPLLHSSVYTEEKADYFLKKYKKKLWEATLNRELQLGMPSELVSEIWRTPDNISKKMTKAKTTQKWEYSDGSYLVFENDKLTEVFNADD